MQLLRLCALFALAAGCGAEPDSVSSAGSEEPRFVGGAVCAECHAAEAERWQGSHHDRAMQEASNETVLGRFDGATFEHFGSETTFTRRGEDFVVRTEGPEGELAAYEVAYTFGVKPLQQYLLRFPRGRLQALDIAWDTRPAAEGGQRWFHLRPEQRIEPGDPLHWTGLAQSWNAMCAECHSTNLVERYDPEMDRYAPTWSELDVSCEACHGPGSRHAAEPTHALPVELRNDGAWRFEEGAPIAQRAPPRTSRTELETCAPCHSRRSLAAPDAEPGTPFLDAHVPALLEEGLYHADGQILDEVYVWGSFVQSRMHAAGVACSDCHEPHALEIENADAACATCHRPAVFAARAHHRHEPGGRGSSCVDCHMPARVYMGVDARRDHSFRVPRPDLSEELGVPNACGDCHGERGAAWAAAAVARWWPDGRSGKPHFGSVLEAGRRGLAGAEGALAALARSAADPAIARATALHLLRRPVGPAGRAAIAASVRDPDPLVRLAAAGAAEALPPPGRLDAAKPLLADPVRTVRLEAARVLADAPGELLSPTEERARTRALDAYRAALVAHADRPEALVSLGTLHARRGEADEARRAYEAALRRAPFFVPASVNLADLLRATGNDEEGRPVLERALERVPDSADAHHALGLLHARAGRHDEAAAALGRAAELAPGSARYAYAHGLALHAAGERPRALAVLRDAHERHPGDRDVLVALATLSRDAGAGDAALAYARALLALDPADANARALVRELE